ncbi:hypothetical protein [Streptomyces regalis]|uniref:Uncharacterized protein n=1 Tax=Streptomyces regalis TaxID=68262 RepID=A0A0X3USF4_9ACTN|nr:hypothetical protein [Streptomyces regalis]KUL35440.1 hypothetical protein ADL12_19815 [Streptomyces regalis]
MNRVVAVLSRVGDAWDRAAHAVAATPSRLRRALSVRRRRRIALVTGAVLLVLYLTAIGDLVFSPSGRWAGMPFAQTEWDRVFSTRAPYLFEPVLVLRTPYMALFLSPVNVLLGAVVAGLAAANIAVAPAARDETVCRAPRARGLTRLLGVLPAFLLGFACCVPAFLLALGTGTAAAVLPFVVPLRPVFYPLSLVLLTVSVVWGARKLDPPAKQNGAADDPPDHAQPARTLRVAARVEFIQPQVAQRCPEGG